MAADILTMQLGWDQAPSHLTPLYQPEGKNPGCRVGQEAVYGTEAT